MLCVVLCMASESENDSLVYQFCVAVQAMRDMEVSNGCAAFYSDENFLYLQNVVVHVVSKLIGLD